MIGFMAAGTRRRAGYILFAVAVAGLTVYMVSVGLAKASTIAEVAGFFVAVIGLALALTSRHSTEQNTREHSHQQMSDVVAGKNVAQDAHVASDKLTQKMERVTSRSGSVHQRVRVIQARVRSPRRDGDHEV